VSAFQADCQRAIERQGRARKLAELRSVNDDKSTRPEIRAMLGCNVSAASMTKASTRGLVIESLPPGKCHLPLATTR
jgi:hypothetical protein